MRRLRWLTAAVAVAVVGSAALVGQGTAPVGVQMADAAAKFLGSLPPELKKKATFPFDSPERLKWHFVPLQNNDRAPLRKGVRFEELDPAQKKAALALLRTGTSPRGFEQATTIMSLEAILHELEKPKKSRTVRNPDWYFVSVFGEPSKSGTWGWRLEGHHLSVNVTLTDGQVAAVTPFVFAANPADIKSGDRKGLRTLADVDDLARGLFQSLDDGQKALAHRKEHFPEIEPTPSAKVGTPVGVPFARLGDAQKAKLRDLMKAYTDRMPGPIAAAEMAAVEKAGLDKVHFAFSGGTGPGEPHTYRVQGPTFVVEFLNVQPDAAGNPANHIHSAWRHLPSDFGLKGS